MATVKGVIGGLFEKAFPGKGNRPGNTWYSIRLEGDEKWYRLKSARYPGIAEKGNAVKFDTTNDDGKSAEVVQNSMVLDQVPPQAAQSAVGAPAQSRAPTFTDNRIGYQSSRKDALELVKLALQADAIKMPKDQAARMEAVENAVDLYTAQYFKDLDTFAAIERSGYEPDSEKAELPDEAPKPLAKVNVRAKVFSGGWRQIADEE